MCENEKTLSLYNILKQSHIKDDATNIYELTSNGYIYNNALSFTNTFVYVNENDKKLILIINGLDIENYKVLKSLNIKKYLEAYDNLFIKRSQNIENLFFKIKNNYSDYKKICLGFSLAGYYTSKFINIDTSFEKYYLLNAVFYINNDKIINYVAECDFLSKLLSKLLSNKFTELDTNNIFNVFLYLNNFDLWFEKNHGFDSLNDCVVPKIKF